MAECAGNAGIPLSADNIGTKKQGKKQHPRLHNVQGAG